MNIIDIGCRMKVYRWLSHYSTLSVWVYVTFLVILSLFIYISHHIFVYILWHFLCTVCAYIFWSSRNLANYVHLCSSISFTPKVMLQMIVSTHGGMARLCWLGWLVTWFISPWTATHLCTNRT